MSPPTKPQFNCGVSPYAVILSYQRRQRRIAVPRTNQSLTAAAPLSFGQSPAKAIDGYSLAFPPAAPNYLLEITAEPTGAVTAKLWV